MRPVSLSAGPVAASRSLLLDCVVVFSALVLHWRLAAQPGGFLATERMTDTDSWTRLIRVLALREGGRWFDEIIPHLNAPDGLSIHWPRLFDLAILAPAVVLEAVGVGRIEAATLAGAFLCPPLHAAAALVASRAASLLWPGAGGAIAGLFVVLNPIAAGYAVVGRADHHIAVLLFGLLGLWQAMRSVVPNGGQAAAAWAGVWLGLAVWLSPEGLLFLVPILAGFGLLWVAGAKAGLGTVPFAALAEMTATAFGLTTLSAVVIEHPPGAWFVIVHDKVSVLHAGLGLLGMVLFRLAGLIRGGPGRRAAWGGVLALAAVAALGAAAPGAFRASFAAADADAAARFLPFVHEMQPLRRDLVGFLGDVGTLLASAIAALPAVALAWRGWRREGRHGAAFLALACLLATAIATAGARRFGVDLAGPAAILAAGLPVMAARSGGLLLRRLVGVAASGLGVPGAALAAAVLAPFETAGPLARCNGAEAVAAVTALGNLRGSNSTRAPVVFADSPNPGAELAWRTGLRAIAAPYHRGGPAFADTHAVVSAATAEDARAVLDRREADYLLLCRAAHPPEASTFAAGLLRGDVPNWLAPLPTPEDSPFALFRILRANTSHSPHPS